MGDIRNQHTIETAAKRFKELTKGYDYFNPSYELIPFIPYILYLRNISCSRIRLMFTAHAPGCYSMEYVLMRLLLIDGDVIIAPSESGKKTIEFLCGGLSPFLESLPHPIHPLPPAAGKPSGRFNGHLATLSRIDPGKLIHRQVEAMSILKDKRNTLKMEIAGPLKNTNTGDYHHYALLLKEKLTALRLNRRVRLHDTITGGEAKSRFLSGARMLICLSATIEEAYPKSAVEALGLGIPVVGTRWDGLPEVVGGCGRLIDVNEVNNGGGVDVAPESIAGAVEMLIDDMPEAAECKEQAQRFSPQRIRPLYKEVLSRHLGKVNSGGLDIDAAKDICAAPEWGLLSVTAPLSNLSWQEVFSIHLDEITQIRRRWQADKDGDTTSGMNLRGMLCSGTLRPLEKFLSFACADRYNKHPCEEFSGGDFYIKIYNAIKSPSTQTSKQICLNQLLTDCKGELFVDGLEGLLQNGQITSGLTYLIIEGEILKGDYDKAYAMCIGDISFREADHFRVRQLAKLCRIMKKPDLALPAIRQWLNSYPYGVHSAEIWLDRCINAAMAGKGYTREAKRSFHISRRLIGRSNILDRVEKEFLNP
ncbi:MAG: glycosyltransferase [Nitrospirae bacterium]|nr:glycosyltransferase [Nitrospirota bacterium]